MSENPSIYLPHKPPMILVDSIDEVNDNQQSIRCSFEIKKDFFLLEDGKVPFPVFIEIMAQASACLKGWLDVHRGLPVRIGYLVGIEEVNFYSGAQQGQLLNIEAIMVKEMSEYFIFESRILNGNLVVAEGKLSFVVI